MVDINEDNEFTSYEHFIKNNKKCINELSNSDIEFIKTLIRKIKDDEIMQCDEEDYIEWESFAIYFNKIGKLVIMHPR